VERHRLTRSETDKVIAGVCGGLAEYFDVDPVLIRIGFVVAAFVGPGIIAYVVMWIAVPRASQAIPAPPPVDPGAGVPPPPPPPGSALRIAEERFARGEISADELAQIRADLEGRTSV
jgi:phage shock protein C